MIPTILVESLQWMTFPCTENAYPKVKLCLQVVGRCLEPVHFDISR